MKRYSRNHSCITEIDQQLLAKSKVCVLGAGGLGGYIVEMLGRIGVCDITVVDGDVFDESNLNRQLISNNLNIGMSKVLCTYNHMREVNDEVKINPVNKFINKDNSDKIIKGHDVVVDALDNNNIRKIVFASCKKLNIPFVYGAIAGWYGQVATIYPSDQTLDILLKKASNKGKEKLLGNPSFTPALVASIEVSEVIKILTHKGELLRNGFLYIDLLANEYEFNKF